MRKHLPERLSRKKKRVSPKHPTLLAALIIAVISAIVPVSGQQTEQRFTVGIENDYLSGLFSQIQKQSDMSFVYEIADIQSLGRQTRNFSQATLTEIMNSCLNDGPLKWELKDRHIIITRKALAQSGSRQQQTIPVNGVVLNEQSRPLAGVSITIPGTSVGVTTDTNGSFRILMGANQQLRFSYIGYTTRIIDPRDASLVRMEPAVEEIEKVVVTGIFNRREESFTGASTTLTGSDLARVSNKNVLESLRNLDPSLRFLTDLDMGSNPNAIPTMTIRGVSSFPSEDMSLSLRGNYLKDPNEPLIILDGFETTAERIMDMDMNRVESITILKDAAAKAIYGSKAANGVIVITTKRVSGNDTYVTYTGSITLEMPDLTSYNLCNSLEKLAVEMAEGYYSGGTFPNDQLQQDLLYAQRLKTVKEGLDTYWLSKPLRTGVSNKHVLNVEVGDSRGLRNHLDFSFNDIKGVMKGNDRQILNGSITSFYRYNNLLFRNQMSVTNVNAKESPYGEFQDYVKMNPYWMAEDENGKILRWAEESTRIPNPMYNSTIGTVNKENYIEFEDNFYIEWSFLRKFRVVSRIGVDVKKNDAEEFFPASHSMFVNYTDEALLRRGLYNAYYGKRSKYSGDLIMEYSERIGKHILQANLAMNVNETRTVSRQYSAEGFSNNQFADISFARQYAEGTTPTSYTTLSREMSFLGAFSYSYEDRYMAELSFRESASSLYGSDKRWAPSWSVGIGWNIHREKFMQNVEWLTYLKLRGSVGVTGNQNFTTNEAITTYKYYTGQVYDGFTGSYISQLPNSGLRWEQKLDYNVGIDLRTKFFALKFDVWSSDSKNLLTDISVVKSTGFTKVKDNLGLVRNYGGDLVLSVFPVQTKDLMVSLSAKITHEKNKIVRISDVMREENKLKESLAADRGNPIPVNIYQDGYSLETIWAVPSAGIDPSNGYEVYIKKDGTLTYAYSASDLVAAGNKLPKYRGNFDIWAEYKGIGLSINTSFSHGAQRYNQTLVDRVENIDIDYNVDRRVLTGRWQTPGQIAKYKILGTFQYAGESLAHQERTRATTRFVQDDNEFRISSISAWYNVPNKFAKKLGMQMLRLSFYMNEIYTFSSIRIERGLITPFSRSMSLQLTATF